MYIIYIATQYNTSVYYTISKNTTPHHIIYLTTHNHTSAYHHTLLLNVAAQQIIPYSSIPHHIYYKNNTLPINTTLEYVLYYHKIPHLRIAYLATHHIIPHFIHIILYIEDHYLIQVCATPGHTRYHIILLFTTPCQPLPHQKSTLSATPNNST